MVKKILLVLAVAIVGLLVFAATRPDTYHVERSTTIQAAPEAVWAAVSDLKAFGEWSPWDKRDPNMKKEFTASTSGVGASYSWKGNKDVGSGKMTITESTAPSKVRQRLEFFEPFASVADVSFTVAPKGAGETTMTWAMDGQNNFVGKIMCVFMDMDKMIGPDFESGLATLKRSVEAKAAAPAAAAAPTAAAEPAAAAAVAKP